MYKLALASIERKAGAAVPRPEDEFTSASNAFTTKMPVNIFSNDGRVKNNIRVCRNVFILET